MPKSIAEFCSVEMRDAGLLLRRSVVGDECVRAVLAARDMAAERCGAAALDCAHHLHLVEADVPGIGSAPRRSVVAEDVWFGPSLFPALTISTTPWAPECMWRCRTSTVCLWPRRCRSRAWSRSS